MDARTTIVTATFNSAGVIDRMLNSVPPNVPVTVVDNASTDETPSIVQCHASVRLIEHGCNLGFGRACNTGASGATTDYLLFLNPDAALEPGALESLEHAADARSDLGAANPIVKDGAGRVHLKMTSPLAIAKMPRPKPNVPGKMPILSGSALFVRRSVFEEVGGFDPAIFLYHEDHELCLRIAAAGYSLWHLPPAAVVHVVGTGTARSPDSARWKGYHMARSRHYVLEKQKNGSGFRRTFLPSLLGMLSPVNWLSARRRCKYVGQIEGALSARRDGGRFTDT